MARRRRRVMDRVYSRLFPSLKIDRFKGLEIVGDIAVVKLPREIESQGSKVGEEVLRLLPSVKVVLRQVSPTSGPYRVRRFEWLAGEHRTVTVHREHGCLFKVDLSKVYFSPRLNCERIRVARLVKPNEVVVNMFAGVGCFSIVIAKLTQVSKVYSIDLNPDAYMLMVENVKLNRVEEKVKPILGDSKTVAESRLKGLADRVLMPLPELAYSYLPSAMVCLKNGGWIHYYDFVKTSRSEDPIAKLSKKVSEKLKKLSIKWSIEHGRTVRTVASRTYQIALDIRVEGVGIYRH